MCIRGCLDPQRWSVPTRSTTASRLSQRLLVSLCALLGMSIESWDVGNAFLKGFDFSKMKRVFEKKGLSSPDRTVIMLPPANTWRHLSSMTSWNFKGSGAMGLKLIKPMYGLNDAPLAWQRCLVEYYLKTLGGHQSCFDRPCRGKRSRFAKGVEDRCPRRR